MWLNRGKLVHHLPVAFAVIPALSPVEYVADARAVLSSHTRPEAVLKLAASAPPSPHIPAFSSAIQTENAGQMLLLTPHTEAHPSTLQYLLVSFNLTLSLLHLSNPPVVIIAAKMNALI